MKWIVALIICFGDNCQPGWIPDTFANKADCEMYGELYSSQARKVYPESEGQLFCIQEDALDEARANAIKEGLVLKPAPTLAVLNDYLEKNPPAPILPQ